MLCLLDSLDFSSVHNNFFHFLSNKSYFQFDTLLFFIHDLVELSTFIIGNSSGAASLSSFSETTCFSFSSADSWRFFSGLLVISSDFEFTIEKKKEKIS